MAAAKKSSKKKSSKSKRENACARGGSEMRTIKGTSPRSVRRRSKAAFDLVTCRKARPVKAKKRAPKKRASVKNGSAMVHGTKRLGERLSAWQGPGSPGINSTGSHFYGGHAVPVATAKKALAELRALAKSAYDAKDRAHAKETARQLALAIAR
jgi:hypothetical protein